MAKQARNIEEQLRQAVVAEGKRQGGLSQNRLAQVSGVHAGQISRFVRGERNLGLASAAKLAKALGLELRQKEG